MSASSKKWYSKSTTVETKLPEEELLVFGYSCKIFRDDEKATYIDQGKHLIPWMGDETLMIDRYDVRGYLHDLKPHEAGAKTDYSEEDNEEERLCDEERYLALSSDLTEQELYHEEELKRLKAAVASDGAYHEIGFSYDSIEDSNDKVEQASIKEEPEDEPYSPPEGLKVPMGMQAPSNMKIHAIIEKTSLFISQQGGQMEIIIKMKQSNNPQFAFMQFDNPLHPYYRHLVQEIKSGHYKPVEKRVSESDDEHHDDHYLHPSLSGVAENVPKFTVPSINFVRTGDDSYSLLVKNLKDRIESDQQRYSPVLQESDNATSNPAQSDKIRRSSVSSTDSDESFSSDSEVDEVTPPPPDVKPVIDKMAEYVAKNGTDFETIVKGKNDKRFEFLRPGNKYYNYYMFKKNMVSKSLSAGASETKHHNKVSQKVPTATNYHKPSNEDVSKTSSNLKNNVNADSVANSDVSVQSSTVAENEVPVQPTCEPASSELPVAPEVPKLKSKPVVKGPICFSLKSKEPEAPLLEKPKKPALLLDDSEDEGENNSAGGTDTPPAERVQHNTVAQSIVPSKAANAFVPSEIEKIKPSGEELEAKLAEDRMKDKLASAVRERFAQQKRDKQLQQERKQKAALFLQMLKKKPAIMTAVPVENAQPNQSYDAAILDVERPKSVTGSPEIRNGSYSSPVVSGRSTPKDIPSSSAFVAQPSPVISAHEGDHWSSSDTEEPIKDKEIGQTSPNEQLQAINSTQEVEAQLGKRKPADSKKVSSKSHKSTKKHKRSKSRSPSRKHKRSRSKLRKEKKLPAAYAVVRRSRSRSPIRYGSIGRSRSPPHFTFNRWR